jgi:hypothetical protein
MKNICSTYSSSDFASASVQLGQMSAFVQCFTNPNIKPVIGMKYHQYMYINMESTKSHHNIFLQTIEPHLDTCVVH